MITLYMINFKKCGLHVYACNSIEMTVVLCYSIQVQDVPLAFEPENIGVIFQPKYSAT
jgi:hypothetical protein